MPAMENLTKANDMKKIREVDFVQQFTHSSLAKLIEVLGVTRKIPMMEGPTMYVLTTTGELANNGAVGEGEIIPLSHFEQTKTPVGEITLKKWRKGVSAEAIKKSGYQSAVRDTDAKLLSLVQNGVRTDLFGFLNGTITGSTQVVGAGLQKALAAAWGQLQVLFEDDTAQAVYFVNPLDVADYLGGATISTQTAFGMNYIEDFLGLGTVIEAPAVPAGTVYGTVKDNIDLYYIPVNGADGLGTGFDFTTDETGLVGIHHEANYARMQVETVLVTGLTLFAERLDGIVIGHIGSF